ncbi:ketoreductase [Tsukamurella pulmonis]|uniref:3-oxoacyl-[acyl-carrier-protein] reductase MabA n=1 Tax=Tsukamurella pulmonis TaxID=47312 RepID=A0A1H1GBX0_9ACTN|nr:SDR family NAD(P)-dependent oxidoreductase [Tsukamurella pulmonis]SDR10599.1 ketoreductase [Tsukamurella pulmonis]
MGALALVTGGTSGIGYSCAQQLRDAGFRVVVTGRRQDKLDRVVDGMPGIGGYVNDVRDRAAVQTLVSAVVAEHGPIDILVNNAGRGGGGPIATITDDLWLDVIETDLNSVFWVTRAVLIASPSIRRSTGRIINIASTGGKQGVPFGTPYSAAKAGVIGFTKALAKEVAPTGLTVNAVCPGYVETPMAVEIRESYAQMRGVSEEKIMQEFESKIPLGRYSSPEEVASMVTYLASPSAASVTAQALNVCGGLGIY